MNFTWNAEDYFQNSQFQYKHAKDALSKYKFNGDEFVLDVGCGDGKITSEIANKIKFGYVTGIDSSKHMIKFADSEFGLRHKNINFSVYSAESIPYKNEFDLIVSFACLHWVENQLAFLISAKNALKKNGKIILNLYPKHPAIWGAIEEATLLSKWKEYFIGYKNPHVSYNIDIYKSLCQKANISIECIEEKEPIAYFKTMKSAGSFLKSWLPHTDQVHPHFRDKFINDIITLFLKRIPKEKNSGIIGVPFRRLDAILLKED